jgi:signal peptidase I
MSVVTAVVVAIVVLCLIAAVLIRRALMVVTVTGSSMEPALSDGDSVLVRRCCVDAVRRGEIVVVLGPRTPGHGLSPAEFLAGATNGARRLMIKRVVALPGDPLPGQSAVVPVNGIVVTGDNEDASYDSRQAGPFDASEVRGVVIRKLTRGTPGRSRSFTGRSGGR